MKSDPDVTRTRSLLIWSQTRYHCATESTDSTRIEINSLSLFFFFLYFGLDSLGRPNMFVLSKLH